MFVVVGAAVATVVDRAARRTAEARRARAEADALAVLAHRLLHSADDPTALLEQACEVFGMTGAAVLRRGPDGTVRGRGPRAGTRRRPTEAADVEVDPGTGRRPGPARPPAAGGRPEPADRVRRAPDGARGSAAGRPSRRSGRPELAEGNRTRTALLAAVSHDLRSPLAAIKAAITSLRNPDIVWSAEDERELLATIEESADRLDSLVGNLLDMSRLQTGAITPLLSDVDLASAGGVGPRAHRRVGDRCGRRSAPDLPTA